MVIFHVLPCSALRVVFTLRFENPTFNLYVAMTYLSWDHLVSFLCTIVQRNRTFCKSFTLWMTTIAVLEYSSIDSCDVLWVVERLVENWNFVILLYNHKNLIWEGCKMANKCGAQITLYLGGTKIFQINKRVYRQWTCDGYFTNSLRPIS